MQKPDSLTTSGRLNYNFHRYFNNKQVTPAIDGQFVPADSGQIQWFFYFAKIFPESS
jgi:hypothetical protein